MPDIVTGKIFVDGEKGITATKLNQIISQAVIQPDFVGTKPSASSVASTDQMLVLKSDNTYARAPFSTVSASVAGQLPLADATQNGMLRKVSGNTSDFIDGTNNSQPLSSGVALGQLRCFNAVGNPTFEVDQISVGANVGGANGKYIDRWFVGNAVSGSSVLAAQINLDVSGRSYDCIPGSNFRITSKRYRLQLSTAKTTLAATEYLILYQNVEGPQWRELSNDVHSIQLLVTSSIAPLKFSVFLTDNNSTHSLVKLCSIAAGQAGVPQLIQLPNLPVWGASNSHLSAPGGLGYMIGICLGAGSSFVAPAADSWQNGNFLGAPGMDNWLNNAINTYFDVSYISHVPGPVSLWIDKPFVQNYEECLRYFAKSYPYLTAIGATGTASYELFRSVTAVAAGTNTIYAGMRFPKQMAKTPTGRIYHHSTGAADSCFGYYATSGTIPNITATFGIASVVTTPSGIANVTSGTGACTSEIVLLPEWKADTGW